MSLGIPPVVIVVIDLFIVIQTYGHQMHGTIIVSLPSINEMLCLVYKANKHVPNYMYLSARSTVYGHIVSLCGLNFAITDNFCIES